jgi:hypothetical protein
MYSQQIVTFTLLHYQGLRNRWWALGQMGLSPGQLAQVPGQRFAKMLGSGAGKGFSILPNFGVYGLMVVWEDEAAARAFFDTHPLFASYKERAGYQTFFMRTIKAHGAWEGHNPFETGTDMQDEKPVAVLTRATIFPRHLWRFWTYVPPVSASIQRHRKDLLLAIGVGELPLIQQATFSIWRNPAAMLEYAYQSNHHKNVVRKTRELGWYSEELFARFHPYHFEGSMDNPLERTPQYGTQL